MAPPLDVSHPSVALYLALVRLQVLTPLSLLINIAACLVCTFLIHPSIPQISREFPTFITPNTLLIGIYWLVVYTGQIAFCVMLIFARKDETKKTLVSLGLSVVFANWVQAAWAVTWILKYFIASTVLLGCLIVFLLYANLNLLLRANNRPISSRPLDTVSIHLPIRLFLILPLIQMFWQNLFVALGHTINAEDFEGHQTQWMWESVAVLAGTNVLGLLIVALRRDVVWTIAAFYVLAALAFGPHVRTPTLVTSIVFMVLYPITLFIAELIAWHRRDREGAIALPSDPESFPDQPDDEVERLRIRVEGDNHNKAHRTNSNRAQEESVETTVWG